MTGPLPMVTERRRALGNPSKRDLPTPQWFFASVESVPPTPAHLMKSGRDAWNNIWSSTPYLNYERDSYWVTLFSDAADEITGYRREIRRIRKANDHRNGDVSAVNKLVAPLTKEIRILERLQIDIRRELGLSPTASARLGLAEVRSVNEFEQFQAKRKANTIT